MHHLLCENPENSGSRNLLTRCKRRDFKEYLVKLLFGEKLQRKKLLNWIIIAVKFIEFTFSDDEILMITCWYIYFLIKLFEIILKYNKNKVTPSFDWNIIYKIQSLTNTNN